MKVYTGQYNFITQEQFQKLDSQGLLMAKNIVDGYSYRGTCNKYGFA